MFNGGVSGEETVEWEVSGWGMTSTRMCRVGVSVEDG